jgi:very-short-patch-repair endonuclease
MLIAREIRKTNITEFIIYMYQVEDMVRAAKFDMERVKMSIISQYEQPPQVMEEIREWYASLIQAMKEEKIEVRGHLQFIQNLVVDLNNLHLRLVEKKEETEYRELYRKAKPNIDILQDKTMEPDVMEIEACLNGLYGYLLMRIRNRKISKDTQEGIETISHLLAHLSMRFREEEG